MPPIPAPIDTPMRSAFSSVTTMPESLNASKPAAKPNWIKVSIRRASLAGMYCSTSKSFTSPAIWELKLLASNLVILLMPDLPATIFAQAVCVPIPTGETTPRPVTTTLRFDIFKCSVN